MPVLVAEDRTRAEEAAAADKQSAMKVEDGGGDGDGDGGLTFDDTSEFFRTLSYKPVVAKTEPAQTPTVKLDSKRSPTPTGAMDVDDEVVEELEAGELVVRDEG